MRHHENVSPTSTHIPTRRGFPAIFFAGTVLFIVALAGCESKGPPSSGGAPVVDVAKPRGLAAGPARVEVAAEGFQPSRVEIGDDHRIVFRRTSDATCATAVAFPDLGVEKQLPLNADVTIELPPNAKGELTFQCGMGMYRGKVVAR